MSEVSSWRLIPLGSVLASIDAGHSPDLEDTPAGQGQWGVLKVSAVGDGIFRPEENKVVHDRAFYEPAICVRPGDLLITRANTPQLIGRSCIVGEVQHGLMLSDKTLRLNVDERLLPARYVQIALGLPGTRRQIENAASGSSGSMKNISQQAIRQLMIPIGLPEDVRRVIEVLDSVGASVDARREIIDKANLVLGQLVESFLSRHPVGRGAVALEDRTLESMSRPDRPILKTGPFGSSLKGDDWVERGVPVVTIGSLRDGYISEDELLHVSPAKAKTLREYRLFEGDIVFSRVADVGRSAVVTRMQSAWIMSSNLTRISVDPKVVIPGYLQVVIAHYGPLREQIRKLTNGSGREVVNDSIMRQLKLPWISVADQQKMLAVINEFKGLALAGERTIAKLDVLRRGLVDDLLTG